MFLRAACVQTNSQPDVDTNIARVEALAREARGKGAELIAFPENVNLMIKGRERRMARVTTEENDKTANCFRALARETGAWLLAGSIGIVAEGEKLANRSYLFAPDGNIAARYDKIHLFDATLSDTEYYRESDHFRGGDKAVLAETPWGKLGLSICYDVRFAHLYRALAKAGASLITIPAAFTATTGALHWHVLTRARAIETGCFVLAPAQCGVHDGGRKTYGHSLIIAPDGRVLAEAENDVGIIMADLDLNEVTEARRKLPCLQHDRAFSVSASPR